MDVHVDQAWRDDKPFRVDDGNGGIAFRRGGAVGDPAVKDEEIAYFVPA